MSRLRESLGRVLAVEGVRTVAVIDIATGMVVVNACPPARLPVTWPAGPIVTARTTPALTSARNRV